MKKKDFPAEVLDVTVTSFDEKGRGFARYFHPPKEEGLQGKQLQLMINRTIPGDRVRVTVPNAKGRRKAVVDYDELLSPSPDRNLNMTEDIEMSGGAPLQYMNYEAQLDYKMNEVANYLEEGGFDTKVLRPILAMDTPKRYRNKMDLTFGINGEIGMHRPGSYRQIIDMKDSILAPEEMVAVKNVVSQWQTDFNLTSYNKDTKEGLLRNLLMRNSFATDELMVVIYGTADRDEIESELENLKERLVAEFKSLASFLYAKHTNISDSIQSEQTDIIYGRDFIYDELCGFTYRIWPDTFFQASAEQAERMVQCALDFAEVDENMRVLDLFCGVGTFSLPFAKQAKELAGIEIVESSIQSARRNAKDNGLDNTYFLVSDARRGMKDIQETWGQPDLLVLDPPRSGAGGKVMRAIGRLGTEKIIYISCNPKSLVEDIKRLEEFGYQLSVVQPVDQFAHTMHVETVVLLSRK